MATTTMAHAGGPFKVSTAPSTPAFCPMSEPAADQGIKLQRAISDASTAVQDEQPPGCSRSASEDIGDLASLDSTPWRPREPAATLTTLEEALDEVRDLVSCRLGHGEAEGGGCRERSDATSDASSSSGDQEELLESFDLAGVARYIEEHDVRRIVVCCGAGVSTNAGIPDFRSPGTGLYNNLQRFRLPKAECMFDLAYFQQHPEPFYELCKEMWPGKYQPTICHHFLRMLADKGLLHRVYTQNIDSLEREAGLPPELVVAAHGNFDSCHVVGDQYQEVPIEELQAALDGRDGGWQGLRERRGGLVKPGITFFGEELPRRFFAMREADMRECELLIVMGTSLVVDPFNELVGMVPRNVPRLLVNREPVGLRERLKGGFAFHRLDNHRDVFYRGDCDSGVRQLARKLGWAAELRAYAQSGEVTTTLPGRARGRLGDDRGLPA